MDEKLSAFRNALDRLGWDVSANNYDRQKTKDEPSRKTLERNIGVSWNGLKEWAKTGEVPEQEAKPTEPKSETKIEKDYRQDTATITTKSLNIQTLEDALEASEVDTTTWEVDRYVINSWEVTMGCKSTETGYPETYTNYQVKVWLKRKSFDSEAFAEEIITLMEAHAPKYDYPPAIIQSRGDKLMIEYESMDLHFGKYAWGKETGEDYDKDIAKDLMLQTLDDLLARTSHLKPEKILTTVGNDFIHVDTLDNTTARGTRQDVDDRSSMLFREGLLLAVNVVDRFAVIAPTEVKIIPGNHDLKTMFNLGTALWGWYRGNDRVVIDDCPKVRKYCEYGNNLIGFVHGGKDDPKLDKLPLIMAQEQKEAWGRTLYREWHTGDKHKRTKWSFLSADTVNGVHVRILPSLSGTDFWHYQKGFTRGERMAEAYVWDYDRGCQDILMSRVD